MFPLKIIFLYIKNLPYLNVFRVCGAGGMDVDAPLPRVWVEGAEAVAEELQGGLVVARRTLEERGRTNEIFF